jgi:hypothetical protein
MMLDTVGDYENRLKAHYRATRARIEGRRPVEALPPPPPPDPATAPIPEPVLHAPVWVDLPDPEELELVSLYPHPMRWKGIILEVAYKHGIPLPVLLGRRRKKWIVAARHEAFYRLSEETTFSLPRIGQVMGGFDHTTVLHGISAHKKRMEAA